jgi:hypothetical protein
LGNAARKRHALLALVYQQLALFGFLKGDDEGFGVCFAATNAALPLGRHEMLAMALVQTAFAQHTLGRYHESETLILAAKRLADSDAERAFVLAGEILAQQVDLHPIYLGQPSPGAQEAALLQALDVLSTRSKAIFAHLARVTAAANVLFFAADRFRLRPELVRWAEALRGTYSWALLQGYVAQMFLINGDAKRAARAYAQIREGRTAPNLVTAMADSWFAFFAAITGETAQAREGLQWAWQTLRTTDTKSTAWLLVPGVSIAVCLLLEARGATEPWLRTCLAECVSRLDQRWSGLSAHPRYYREAGRLVLGRSTLAAITEAKRAAMTSCAQAPRQQTVIAISAAAALRLSQQPDCQTAALAWAEEAMQLASPLFPPAFVSAMSEALGQPRSRAPKGSS